MNFATPVPALKIGMKTLVFAALTLCATIGFACAEQPDTTQARAELREAIDAAVKAHPEIADQRAFVASRVKGKNGWEGFKKLAAEWAALREREDSKEWVSAFDHVQKPTADSYSETQLKHFRTFFGATAGLSAASTALLSNDCIVPTPQELDDEAVVRRTYSFADLLCQRAIVTCLLGLPADEIRSATELACRFAMKLDIGWSILGRVVTFSFREAAFGTALTIAETQADRSALLESILAIAPVRAFSPRDAWLGLCTSTVQYHRESLNKTDAEIVAAVKGLPSAEGKSALELLQWAKRNLEMECAFVAHIPSSSHLRKPQDAKRLMDSFEALSKDQEPHIKQGFANSIRTMIEVDLLAAMMQLVLDLRIDEARTGSLPDTAGQKRLLAAYDGLTIRQTGDGLEVTVAGDHPTITLLERTDHIPRKQVQPWPKQ